MSDLDWGVSSLWYKCTQHGNNVVRVGARDEMQMMRLHRLLYSKNPGRCVFEKVKLDGMG